MAKPQPQQALPQEETVRNHPQTAPSMPAGSTVANTTGGALVSALIDFSADAGAGLEGADKDTMAIPFISVLQGLSPQVAEGLVEGAKPGLFINTVTNELSTNVRVIPVAFQRRFNRWVPRAKGGGFKGAMMPSEVDQLMKDGKAKEVLEMKDGRETRRLMYEEDELIDTRTHFVLLLSESGAASMAIVGLAKTSIKYSKRWLALINSQQETGTDGKAFTPPSFSRIYKGSTEKQTKSQGTWFTPKFETDGKVTDPALYGMAKKFYQQVAAGEVQVVPPESAQHAEESEGGEKF